MYVHPTRILFIIGLALGLAACGNGGGGGGGASPAASTTCTWDSSTWDNCTLGS